MPRDMTGAQPPPCGVIPLLSVDATTARTCLSCAGTGRFPPQPRFQPYAFYSCVRLGDSEQLKLVRYAADWFASRSVTVRLPATLRARAQIM
jgi:hypothetical protein